MARALLVLAQMTTTPQGTKPEEAPAIWYLFVLLLIVVIAFVLTGIVVYYYRRRLINEDADQPDAPLSLADVRALHHTGQIDDAEMEKLKKLVLDDYRETFDLAEGHATPDTPEEEGPPEKEEDSRKTEGPSHDAGDSEDHED